MAKLPIETLDTTRPFAYVAGESDIAYSQKSLGIQSWPYDAQHNLLERLLNDDHKKKLAERRELAGKSAAKEQPAPVDADALAKAAAEDIADKQVEKAGDKSDDESDVNLLMWLKGEVRYKPFEIQNAIKARYGANKPKLQDAALYLVEEKNILPREQVHPSILAPLPK